MLSVVKRVSPRKESEYHSDKKSKRRSEYKDRDESPDRDFSYKDKRYDDKHSSKSHKRSKEVEKSPQHKMSLEVESSPHHKSSKKYESSKRPREEENSPPHYKKPKGHRNSPKHQDKLQEEDSVSSPKWQKKSKARRRSKSEEQDDTSRHKQTESKAKQSTKKHKRTIWDEASEDEQDNDYTNRRYDDSEMEFGYEKSKSFRTENRRGGFPKEDFRERRRESPPGERNHNFNLEKRSWKHLNAERTSERKVDDTQRSEKQRDSMSEKQKKYSNTQDDLPVEPTTDQTPAGDSTEPLSKRMKMGNINMKTGGAYIPPARLRMMQDQIKDKGSEAYQRIAWEALKKSIVGMTNKINSSNIAEIVPELFKENIIRGRGVLTRAIMQAQSASPTFTRVYAALVAIINTKFPEIGELMLKRLIIQYRRGFRRNDKTSCMSAARFLAHLLNHEVAHEVLILEIVTHLFENPTNDSVEIAIATLKECGKKLTELTPKGMRAITQRVRDVLHEGSVDVRVRYMIEVYFAIQKDGFKDFEIIPPELDLVEEDDKCTHLINLDDAIDSQEMLNVFKFDLNYEDNEEKYKAVVKVSEILGEGSDEEGSGDESGSGDDEEEDEESKAAENQQIIDMTETNIVVLRRKIYLIVQSSLDFEECAHKLLKLELKPGQILEMCYMILDCCAQQRTYEKFFGLLAQRFCQMNKIYVDPFTEIFDNSYKTIHRLETNKLRNVAKFFAHLLYTDAISWMVLANIKLNEEDTTSSSRIFIKILFQELCEYMGLTKLNERVKDITLQEAFEGLFPRDHPHNTRFAINFFTSIGLGGLTDELREHLKNLPKNPMPVAPPEVEASASSSSDSSSSSSSSDSSSSSSSSSSESEESDHEQRKQKQQKRKRK